MFVCLFYLCFVLRLTYLKVPKRLQQLQHPLAPQEEPLRFSHGPWPRLPAFPWLLECDQEKGKCTFKTTWGRGRKRLKQACGRAGWEFWLGSQPRLTIRNNTSEAGFLVFPPPTKMIHCLHDALSSCLWDSFGQDKKSHPEFSCACELKVHADRHPPGAWRTCPTTSGQPGPPFPSPADWQQMSSAGPEGEALTHPGGGDKCAHWPWIWLGGWNARR